MEPSSDIGFGEGWAELASAQKSRTFGFYLIRGGESACGSRARGQRRCR
jgi:hypothetical protein